MADLYLKEIAPNDFADAVASRVVNEIRQELARLADRRLVDRVKMAELIGVSVPKLDELVREQKVPSILVGTRRVFDPESVFTTLKNMGGDQ